MSIPDYQSFMLPVLKLASDGQEHRLTTTVDELAHQLNISEDDQAVLIPSGTQTRMYNRVGWAITYLNKAGLLDKPKRGYFQITTRGLNFLKSNPSVINNKMLSEFSEFTEFVGRRSEASPSASQSQLISESTPEELIDSAIDELHEALASEIADQLAAVDPGRFEQIVVDLLVAMGYGGSRTDAAQVIGKPGDGGIDGTIKEDRLGLDVIYIQAKRWQGTVGRKEVQSFAGSLEGVRASKGIFITTSGYSAEALRYVKLIGKRIILIDGRELAKLMIAHSVGVTPIRTLIISKLDGDYFE